MWTVTNVVEPIDKLAAEFALMSAVVTVDLQAIAQVVMQTATMVVVGPAVRTLCRGQCPGCSPSVSRGTCSLVISLSWLQVLELAS